MFFSHSTPSGKYQIRVLAIHTEKHPGTSNTLGNKRVSANICNKICLEHSMKEMYEAEYSDPISTSDIRSESKTRLLGVLHGWASRR